MESAKITVAMNQFSPVFFWFQEVGLSVALSAAALELQWIQFRFAIALSSKPAQLEEPPPLSAVQLAVPGSSLAADSYLDCCAEEF